MTRGTVARFLHRVGRLLSSLAVSRNKSRCYDKALQGSYVLGWATACRSFSAVSRRERRIPAASVMERHLISWVVTRYARFTEIGQRLDDFLGTLYLWCASRSPQSL